MSLSHAETEALSEKLLGLVEADEAELWIEDREALQLRYANNDLTSNGKVDGIQINLSVSYGQRSASVSLNRIDEPSLTAAVDRAQAMAKLAPEDPEHMPPVDPQRYDAPITFAEDTAAMTPAEALARLRPVIEQARAAGVDSAGYLQRTVAASTLANSRGLFVRQRRSDLGYSLTARTRQGSGSGWASTQVTELSDLDLEPVGERAIAKALDSREARERAPGRTRVVLEAAAVRDLLNLLTWSLDRRSFDEGRSFLNGLVEDGQDPIGKPLFGDLVTLVSDPLFAPAPCATHAHGLPRERQDWIRDGVLRRLSIGRHWAKKQGTEPQPGPGNLIMPGEGRSLEDLMGLVEDGVLVTRLWYLRMVQPQSLLYTGLTRDGTFAIRNGEIAEPVNNFRFNESPVNVLRNLAATGQPERVLGSESRLPTHVPPAVVDDFNLSSVSDAS